MNPSQTDLENSRREERSRVRRRRQEREAHAWAAALLSAAREALASGNPGVTAGTPTHLWLRSLAAREVTGNASEFGLQAVADADGLRELPGGTEVCTNDLRLLTVHRMDPDDVDNLLDMHCDPMIVGPLPASAYPLTIWA